MHTTHKRTHNLQIKQRHTKHTTVYTIIQNRTKGIWKKYDKRNSQTNSEHHLIYISSNNDTIHGTPFYQDLHSTSIRFSTLHFPFKTSSNYTSLRFITLVDTSLFPFKLHPTTLHSASLHLSTLHFFPFKLHPTTLHCPHIWLNPI